MKTWIQVYVPSIPVERLHEVKWSEALVDLEILSSSRQDSALLLSFSKLLMDCLLFKRKITSSFDRFVTSMCAFHFLDKYLKLLPEITIKLKLIWPHSPHFTPEITHKVKDILTSKIFYSCHGRNHNFLLQTIIKLKKKKLWLNKFLLKLRKLNAQISEIFS